MKTIVIVTMSVGMFLLGCTDEATTPTKKPIVVLTADSGIISGKGYIVYTEGQSTYFRNSGVIIDLLGTSNTTTTDSLGNWVLRNIDSGVYSIRFTKPGPYDTMYIYKVYSNGKDSSHLKEVITDTTWKGIQLTGGAVRELPPVLSVTTCKTSMQEAIRIDTIKDHGVIEIKRDTTYNWEAEFSIGVDAPNKELNDRLPVSYMCCFTENPTLSASELPDKPFLRTTQNKRMGYWSEEIERVPPGEKPIRSFLYNNKSGAVIIGMTSIAKGRGITKSNGKKLYFHIIPICQALVRTTDEQWGTPNVIRKQNIMSPAQSFEIQWK